MPQINDYNDHVVAQGQLDVHATPGDFGAQVGQAVEGLGAQTQRMAEVMHQNDVTNDVTAAHVQLAKQRDAWQQELQNRANAAQPGDDTFAPKLIGDINAGLTATAGQFSTKQGQQTYQRMAASMASEFGQQAIAIQGHLAGEAAKNQFTDLSNSLGSVAAQDHTQWKSLVDQATAAIDDPNSRFARVPQTTRDQFKQTITEQIKYDAARGFARRYPDAVLGSVPPDLRESVQRANTMRPPAAPTLPPDLGASRVKPYSQPQVNALASKVNAPSQYDQIFKDAADQYGLDWRELKLRSAAESGFNPEAQSSQGAQGVMQFMPATARALGVDPSDPKSAIFGAAKMLADYRTKADGDMAKVDMMYYGGESGTGWGANTRQYAANLAAARNAVGLGSQVQPQAFAPQPLQEAGAAADWKKPSTGIDFIDSLPAAKFFDVLTEAEHYQRAENSYSERSRMEADRLKRQQQDQVMTGFLQRVVDPTNAQGGALTEREIVNDPTLSWEQRQHMVQYLGQRERELSAGMESKTNPVEVRSLMLQIHAADTDPAKTYNMDPVMESYRLGRISTNEMRMLRTEVEQMKDGTSSGFQKRVQNARELVYQGLTRSIIGQAQPEVAIDAAYRFNADMDAKITALRKDNKDPSTLLDPMSRDYLLKPERLQTFMQRPGQAAAAGAAGVVAAAKPGMASYKDYDKLDPGAQYVDPQGNVRTKVKK
jgi:soluble lytic murein transglycosylase-like protein